MLIFLRQRCYPKAKKNFPVIQFYTEEKSFDPTNWPMNFLQLPLNQKKKLFLIIFYDLTVGFFEKNFFFSNTSIKFQNYFIFSFHFFFQAITPVLLSYLLCCADLPAVAWQNYWYLLRYLIRLVSCLIPKRYFSLWAIYMWM